MGMEHSGQGLASHCSDVPSKRGLRYPRLGAAQPGVSL